MFAIAVAAQPRSGTTGERVVAYRRPLGNDPVTLDPAGKSRDDLTISGVLSYQACDDKLCYPPATASVTWTVKVK